MGAPPGEARALTITETPLLELDGIDVSVRGRAVLRNVDLTLGAGECHVLFGPNGSGKSALVMCIMGLPGYTITSGQMRFRGEEITHLPSHERARRGIGLFYQRPPTVHGVSLRELAAMCQQAQTTAGSVESLAGRLRCVSLLDRDVNDGFSGGEIKLSELLQLLAREPALSLIDEPDAGVDVDNLAVVGSALRGLIAGEAGCCPRAAILITHSGRILDYVKPDVGHVLIGGTLVRHGDPMALFAEIRANGYGGLEG
jgi:Fe-S cluster assembly ATP-binding protein